MAFQKIIAFYAKHKYCIIYGLVGFISAILMLTIGFFKTLLLLLLTGFGVAIGWLLDKHGLGAVWSVIKRIFKKG